MTQELIDELTGELVKEILMTIAMEIERRAVENLREHKVMGTGISVRFTTDVTNIENGEISVSVDSDTAENGMDIAVFLNFGTGIYGERRQFITANHKTKKGEPGYMRFRPGFGGGSSGQGPIPGNKSFKKDGFVFTQKSRGMKPTFFFTKAVEDTLAQKNRIIRDVLSSYGIGGAA